MKYCANCKQFVEPTKGINWIFAIILIICFVIPGILYILWAYPKGGKCPMCNSRNWTVPPKEKE